MFKKLIFALAVIAVALMLSQEKASAQHGISIGFGSPGFGHSYSAGRIGVPVSPYYNSGHRGHSHVATPYSAYRYGGGHRGGYGGAVYRSGYRSGYGGGYGNSYCPSRGYRTPYYGGGSGISFRIGF